MVIKEQHVLEGRKSNSREKEIKNSKPHNVWRHWKEKYQMTHWFTTNCRRKANDKKYQRRNASFESVVTRCFGSD